MQTIRWLRIRSRGRSCLCVSWLLLALFVAPCYAQEVQSPNDVWHDRAVFHFLTNAADRRAYVGRVRDAVKPGGHVMVATFGPEGPLKCSGLDVVRYDAETLHGEFGAQFELVKYLSEQHHTPFGTIQQFLYCYFKLAG